MLLHTKRIQDKVPYFCNTSGQRVLLFDKLKDVKALVCNIPSHMRSQGRMKWSANDEDTFLLVRRGIGRGYASEMLFEMDFARAW